MKFISSIVLLLAVTSLAASINETQNGGELAASINETQTGGKLACDNPEALSTNQTKTEWSSTNIYAVQVCAVSDVAVNDCNPKTLFVDAEEGKPTESSLTLNITLEDTNEAQISVSKPFQLSDLTEKKSFCHTFPLCDILLPLKGKKIDGSKISAAALLVGNSGTEAGTFNVTMKATGYTFKKAGQQSVTTDAPPFSVVCSSFSCTVTADKEPTVTNQALTLDGAYAPQCPPKEAGDEANKLSVSVFECAGAKCPTLFTISDASSASSTSPSPTPSTSESGSSQTEGSQTEGSETETESSSALHITGMGSAFFATILAFIA